MSTTQEVLDAIFKNNECPMPSGRTVKLRKVTVRTLNPVIGLVANALEDLKEMGGLAKLDVEAHPEMLLKLISKHYDEAVALVPLLADIQKEEVYDLDPADMLLLVQAIVLLNKDFFTKTVLPALGLAKEVSAAVD